MEHDWETGKFLFNSLENIECQWRRNELAVFVLGALFRSELVSTVRCAYRDSQAVAAGASSKVYYFFRVGVGVVVARYFVFNASQYTEFAFNSHVELVCIFNNLLGEGDVFFVRKVRTVNHNRRETAVNAVLAKFVAIAVVEVKHDLWFSPAKFLSVFNSSLSHVAKESCVSIVASALRYLKDNRRLGFRSSLDDSLKLLHVVEVESRNCITAFNSLSKHFASVYEAKIFIIYHLLNI